MNEEIKTQWCEALRSGKFVQTQGQLKYESTDGSAAYCCLGVLTNLFCRAKKKAWNRVKFNEKHTDGEYLLPKEVMEWAELKSCDPIIKKRTKNRLPKTLSQLNDSGKTFEEIADKIEKKL